MGYLCEKCGKTKNDNQFYTYRNGDKVEMCKDCLTMHVNNFEPDTFLWILQKLDVPYIETEWNILRDKDYAKDPNKVGGSATLGKYLSKMKLNQWKSYRWADTERIAQENAAKRKKTEEEGKKREEWVKAKYEAGEMSEAEYKTLMSAATQNAENTAAMAGIGATAPQSIFYNEGDFIDSDLIPDLGKELTEEDKIRMAMKWGRLYKPSEWVELEKFYTEMTNSFDIQDADTTNTLIVICKTNLKMNQALDNGDLDGFQKLSRVYEALRKSAKFTAAQNKEEKNDYVDCVGELVALCEKEGFIPRYVTDIPQDKVDLTLKDMNDYLHKLVTQDLGFGQQIEDSLKKIQIQKEMQLAEEQKENPNDEIELEDEDYQEFYEAVEEQKRQDDQLLEEDE